MSYLLTITLWIFLGWITSHFAQQRGRDPLIWFFAGMFLGLIGLLLLFLLPAVSEEQEKSENVSFDREETTTGSSSQTVEIQQEPISVKPEYTLHEWYYLDQERRQQGPLPFDKLKKQWTDEKITPLTYVWSQGMESWKKIEELPDLRNALLSQHINL